MLNYPRRGRGPIHRWIPSWRFVVGGVLFTAAAGVGAIGYLYVTTDIPEPDDVALAQSTMVYYSDAETELGSFAEVRRTSVALADLPDYVPAAVVASEDQRFYDNVGIDPVGIARAAWNNVRGGPRQGGSTLTQQYVERYYTGTTTDIPGKLREMALAVKIDQSQSKDEILENYLNTIYFGRGAYGIEAAAQAYFGKPAEALSMSEAALLVAVIPSPSNWDPAENEDMAIQRWERVVRRMVEDGWITQETSDSLTFPEWNEPGTTNQYEGPNGYILAMVRDELIASGAYTAAELDTAGLTIITTIDPQMQQAAIDAVASLPDDRPESNHTVLISAEPSTGEIRAVYAGENYLERERNGVTQDRLQGGSTFKPFTLLAAIEQDWSVWTTYPSFSPMVIQDYEVENFDQRNHGRISLVQAMAGSVNTPFVQLNNDIGPAATMDIADRAGVPADTPGFAPELGNVLGSASPHPIEVATAYSTFANQGNRPKLHIVREVRDADSDVTFRGTTKTDRVFEPQHIAELNVALQAVTAPGGTGATAGGLDRPTAGKTGTSTGYTSAWFGGYIPQLVTVVGMYEIGPDGEERSLTPFGDVHAIGGGSFPTDVWLEFMQDATEGMPIEEFPAP